MILFEVTLILFASSRKTTSGYIRAISVSLLDSRKQHKRIMYLKFANVQNRLIELLSWSFESERIRDNLRSNKHSDSKLKPSSNSALHRDQRVFPLLSTPILLALVQ